jgi:predicted DCC family thiol-disulfide oxidoreductase YuxK
MKTRSQERAVTGVRESRRGRSEPVLAFPGRAFLRSNLSVSTEITDHTDRSQSSGWVFYDGECAVCLELAARFGGVLRRAGFALVAFQHPWAGVKLGLQSGEVPDAARVVATNGATTEGAEAMLVLADRIWWAKPLAWLGRWPLSMRGMRRGYAWFAARRHCIGGACGLKLPSSRHVDSSTAERRKEMQ